MAMADFTVPASVATVLNQISAAIYRLHDLAEVAEFKAQALNLLTETVAFDHAFWLCCAVDSEPEQQRLGYDFDAAKGVGQWHRNGAAKVTEHDGQSLCDLSTIQCGEKHRLDFEIGLDRAKHQLTLLRHEQNQPFDSFDADVTRFMVENMVGAFDLLLHHRLAHIPKENCGRAICDQQGRVLKADSEFIEWMCRQFPDWTMAQSIPALKQDPEQGLGLIAGSAQSMMLNVAIDGDLHQLKVYQTKGPQAEWDKLTPTEFDVVWRLSQGLTPKQLAKLKGLSVSTIGNQIDSIHKKLGFKKNTEVIEAFIRAGLLDPDKDDN